MKIVKLITLLLIPNLLNSQSLPAIIVKEYNILKKVANIDSKLALNDGYNIKSKLNGEIEIGINEIKKILIDNSSIPTHLLIRLILAHEVAHQVQFRNYKNSSKLNGVEKNRMLLEAQADILAGFYWTSSYFLTDTFDIDKQASMFQSLNSDSDIIENMFTLIKKVGIKENSFGTHPSENDRLICIQHGFAIGGLKLLDMILEKYPDFPQRKDKNLIQTIAERHHLKNYINISSKKFDFNLDEMNLLDWSYNHAKLIINYDQDVLKNLVLLKSSPDAHIKFHKDINYPYVESDLRYLNISSKTISVQMYIYVAHVKTNDPENAEFYKKINFKKFKFDIKPRQVFRIKGKTRWDRDKLDSEAINSLQEGFHPKIVFPGRGSRDELISVSYKDGLVTLNEEELFSLNLNNKRDHKLKTSKSLLLRLIRYLKSQPHKLYYGIGDLYELEDKSIMIHKSSKKFDVNSKISITREFQDKLKAFDKHYKNIKIIISYPDFTKYNEFHDKFNYLKKICNETLNDYDKEVTPYRISYKLKGISVTISKIHLEKKNKGFLAGTLSIEIKNTR